MPNYKMVFSYDGARYNGWQKLGNGELTIQGTIEDAISEVLRLPVEIHGSGRTDAGVHAKGQVASMKVSFLLKESFRDDVNQKLPEDIRLLFVERVQGEFHARYSATKKTYSYHVDTNEKPRVFGRKFACHHPEKLDMNAMQQAAEALLGQHDFSSFTDDKTKKDKVRTIYDIRINEERGVFRFEYIGDGFLQHMVRILTGTLLEVGCGKRNADDIPRILEMKERASAGFMVPGKGLFLEKVFYD